MHRLRRTERGDELAVDAVEVGIFFRKVHLLVAICASRSESRAVFCTSRRRHSMGVAGGGRGEERPERVPCAPAHVRTSLGHVHLLTVRRAAPRRATEHPDQPQPLDTVTTWDILRHGCLTRYGRGWFASRESAGSTGPHGTARDRTGSHGIGGIARDRRDRRDRTGTAGTAGSHGIGGIARDRRDRRDCM